MPGVTGEFGTALATAPAPNPTAVKAKATAAAALIFFRFKMHLPTGANHNRLSVKAVSYVPLMSAQTKGALALRWVA